MPRPGVERSKTGLKCSATSRQTGERCKLSAGFGTNHLGYGLCRFHGGVGEAGEKHAEREQAEYEVALYGLARDIDPHTALLEELYRSAGHVSWLQSRIAQMEDESELVDLEGGGGDAEPKRVPSVWLRMYSGERVHFAKIAKTCIDVGIAERQVQLAEQQGALIARVLTGVLTDLGVDVRAPKTRETVRRHLTVVSAGEAA